MVSFGLVSWIHFWKFSLVSLVFFLVGQHNNLCFPIWIYFVFLALLLQLWLIVPVSCVVVFSLALGAEWPLA